MGIETKVLIQVDNFFGKQTVRKRIHPKLAEGVRMSTVDSVK